MAKAKFLLALAFTIAPNLLAQTPLKILKIDPPNWYANLPKPMLLVRGEGFTGATFTLCAAVCCSFQDSIPVVNLLLQRESRRQSRLKTDWLAGDGVLES